MTGERVNLEAIEARASAATEGPWLVEEADDVWELYAQRDRTHHGYKLAKCMKSGQPYAEYWPNERDAAFISHARQDIPALIAEVRSLRAQVAALAGEKAATGRRLDAAEGVVKAALAWYEIPGSWDDEAAWLSQACDEWKRVCAEVDAARGGEG